MAGIEATIDPGADDLFTGGHVEPHDRRICPRRALWLACIARCWSDAFEASDFFLKASSGATNRKDFDSELVRADARRWLTLEFGDWRSDRETVCDFAGVDERMLRSAARRKLAAVRAAESENRTAEVIPLDTMFAALLADADGMAADELDIALEALAEMERAA